VAMQHPDHSRERPCAVAGLGLIRVAVDHDDGTSHLILQGLSRIELGDTVQQKPYRVQEIRPLRAEPKDNVVVDALVAKVHELVERRVKMGDCPFPFPALRTTEAPAKKPGAGPQFSAKDLLHYLENLQDADQVADLVSCALLPGPLERQKILETVELETRLKQLIHFLMDEIARCELEKKQ
jgi:ATP-dependent Lon protease